MTTPPPLPGESIPDRIILRVGGAKMPIESGRSYTIGRDPGNDLRLAHSSISGRHAKLLLLNGQVVLEDLNSATGVWLGKYRLEAEQVLLPGMKVRIGEIELEFEDSSAPPVLPATGTVPHEKSTSEIVIPAASPGQTPTTTHRPGHHDESFAEIMAEQLRHAPWFALSIALHAVLLMLLWVLMPPPKSGTAEQFQFRMVASDSAEDGITDEEIPVEEVLEVEEAEDTELQELAEINEMIADLDASDNDNDVWSEDASSFGREASIFQRLGGGKKNDILSGGGGGAGKSISRGFKKTADALRRSGLDICFVFDSTGSMGPVLKTTKESITKMVDVLHALVPNSRIGIVTFRDKDDDYLTRTVPVSSDYYR